MATLSLGQAAKLANVGKTTLARAIKSGRLSAERQVDGSYRIDPAELSRVYELRAETGETGGGPVAMAHRAIPERDPDVTARLAAAEAEVRALREMLARVDSDRDAWRAAAENAAASIRLLADQREGQRSWWRRVVGG